MDLIPRIVVLFIAAEHLYILWMEMFAWKTAGKKMLPGFIPSFFEETKVMAANQGFIIAGVYGALTSSKTIFFKQALPAIAALFIVIII